MIATGLMCEPDCGCRGNCEGEFTWAGPVTVLHGMPSVARSFRFEPDAVLDLDRLRTDLCRLAAQCASLGVPHVQASRALTALSAVEAVSQALQDREG